MANKLSKRAKENNKKIDRNKSYSLTEALALAKACASAKFKESVDVSIKLGIDVRKSDQVVRGATLLPKGTGREVRVAVFAQGVKADEAITAGADVVGFEDLAEQVQKGELNFDVVIATPEAMRIVGKLGQILGPRGLMPNPKVGTVAADVATAVKNVKAGQVRYRADKGGIVHCSIGNATFDASDLQENFNAIIADVKKAKPASAKGIYIKKITISSTMGPGIIVDASTIDS